MGDAEVAEAADEPTPTVSATPPAEEIGAAAASHEIDATEFQPLTPARLLDTRRAIGVPVAGKLGPGETITLDVTGRGGVPDDGVAAVVLNLTSTEATAEAFLTAWPSGTSRPLASNLNTDPGTDTPNLAFVGVGVGGNVEIYNSAGEGHVVADVLGWFPATATYHPLQPARLLDTRRPIGVPVAGTVGPASTTTLQVAGREGVPLDGVDAVVLNVTSTEATTQSFVTVWPTGEERPRASNLNTDPGTNTPNLTIVKLGTGGAVDLYNEGGEGHLVADVLGWFPTGSAYRSISPERIVDTRRDQGLPGPLDPAETLTLDLPDEPIGALVVNITSTAATERSFLTAWPWGVTRPLASNLNTDPGQNTPNLAIIKIGDLGDLGFYNSSGTGELVVDVLGWFTTASTLVEIDEPGIEGHVEIPATTHELPSEAVVAVVPAVTPTGPPVTMTLERPNDPEPTEVGDVIELSAEALPPGVVAPAPPPLPPELEEEFADNDGTLSEPNGQFTGEVTAVSDLGGGAQQVTVVPGELYVQVLTERSAPRAEVGDHVLVPGTPALPDGFIGKVTVSESLLGYRALTAVPGTLDEAFLDVDLEVDPSEAGVVPDPGAAVTGPITGVPRSDPPQPPLPGNLSFGTSLDTVADVVQAIGLGGPCQIEGIDAGFSAGIGWRFSVDWKWYLFVPVPRVVALVEPYAEAFVTLQKASVACQFELPVVGFSLPITKNLKATVALGLVIDVEAGVTGFDLHATADAGVRMGWDGTRAKGDRFVWIPYSDADQNLSEIDGSQLTDPADLALFAQVDLWFSAGVTVIGLPVFEAAFGPFAEFTMTANSTAPWWALDIGVAAKVEVFERSVYESEIPVIFDWLPNCPADPPWDEQPCRSTPPPGSTRANGDVRVLHPRMRFSADGPIDPLRITTSSLVAVEQVAFAQPLATDGWFPAVRWDVVGGSLPPGMSLGDDGVVRGTPPVVSTPTTWTFTAQAWDAADGPAGGATRSITLTVWPDANITGAAERYFFVGEQNSVQLTAEGRPGFTWSSPDLPGWLSLSPDGVLTGTPPVEKIEPVRFHVVDGNGRVDDATVGIAVVQRANQRLEVGDWAAGEVDVSADGRVVTFHTRVGLDPADVDGMPDVYVYDRVSGLLTLADVPAAEAVAPSISDDGGTIAFFAYGMGPPDGDYYNAILYDVAEGIWVNIGTAQNIVCAPDSMPGVPDGHQSLCESTLPYITSVESVEVSGDGSAVAYVANGHVVVHDVPTGTTRLVHVASPGQPQPLCPNPPTGSSLQWTSSDPSISDDGTKVAFTTGCYPLSDSYVVVADLATGALVDVASDRQQAEPSLSGDGTRVAVIDYDGTLGSTVRVHTPGSTAAPVVVGAAWAAPSLDDHGTHVAYLATSDTIFGTGTTPVVVRSSVPALAGEPTKVSFGGAGVPDAAADRPAISGDGSMVVYGSFASDIVPGDTDGTWDVFIWDPAGTA